MLFLFAVVEFLFFSISCLNISEDVLIFLGSVVVGTITSVLSVAIVLSRMLEKSKIIAKNVTNSTIKRLLKWLKENELKLWIKLTAH